MNTSNFLFSSLVLVTPTCHQWRDESELNGSDSPPLPPPLHDCEMSISSKTEAFHLPLLRNCYHMDEENINQISRKKRLSAKKWHFASLLLLCPSKLKHCYHTKKKHQNQPQKWHFASLSSAPAAFEASSTGASAHSSTALHHRQGYLHNWLLKNYKHIRIKNT